MTEEEFWHTCKNQTLWRNLHLQNQKMRLQHHRDICRDYQTNKRRNKGIVPRYSVIFLI